MPESFTHTRLIRNPDGTITTECLGPEHVISEEVIILPPGADLGEVMHHILEQARADVAVVRHSAEAKN